MNLNTIKNTIKNKVFNTKHTWVISVGGGYGSFFFEGTESEAEEMRKHKANWEKAIARKRLADKDEIHTRIISKCKNHPNFNTTDVYHCECEHCKHK